MQAQLFRESTAATTRVSQRGNLDRVDFGKSFAAENSTDTNGSAAMQIAPPTCLLSSSSGISFTLSGHGKSPAVLFTAHGSHTDMANLPVVRLNFDGPALFAPSTPKQNKMSR